MFGLFFDTAATIAEKVLAPVLRSTGKKLYVVGTKIEGEDCSEDRLVPSLRNLHYEGSSPNLEGAQFIAPNATIVGKVILGTYSSVWYGATLIGTKGITIGNYSVIQDRTHVSNKVNIGQYVFVGPNSIIQGSQLADNSFISMGATVRHAKVESGAFVAAGAVIPDNAVVKQGEIWAGNPGKFLRNITPVQREVLIEHIEQMRNLAIIHAEETQKSSREVISGKSEPFQSKILEERMQDAFTELEDNEMPISELDEQFIERRTIMRQKPTYFDSEVDYEPYEHNTAHMGEKINLGVHHEAYQKVATKISKKERFDTDNSAWTKPF